MLVQHMLAEHPFATGVGQTCMAWSVLAEPLSNWKYPDGNLEYGGKGTGEKATKK